MIEDARPNRRERRAYKRILRNGKRVKGSDVQLYADNVGVEYDYKWVAKVMSFLNIINGCFKNGFPVATNRLHYPAWAFYPFFFMKKNYSLDPFSAINHERIHIRQQREILILFGIPSMVIAILYLWQLLLIVPFIPTIFYGIDFIQCYFRYKDRCTGDDLSNFIRSNTCFEREAISNSLNEEYLIRRKFFAFLGYSDVKLFRKIETKDE